MNDTRHIPDLVPVVASVVASYVSRSPVPVDDLPALIRCVTDGFARLGGHSGPLKAEDPVPAVPVKKSVHHDYIVCLEDGKKVKMLRRHLRNSYGMTPEEYLSKWRLPADYPMVAPAYTEQRSGLAKKIGLGTRHRG